MLALHIISTLLLHMIEDVSFIIVVQEADSIEAEFEQLLLTSGDCAKLMPDGSPAEAAQVAELEAHLKVCSDLHV